MIIRSAYIEITNICNLNCRSCYNRSGARHERRELALEDFKPIVTRLRDEFSCERITLSGGEPTLHTQFAQMLDWVLSQGLEIAVVTNGTTQSKSLLDAVKAADNLFLQLSLDGSTEEINARTRGDGHFAKALAFLNSLPDGTKPRLRMTVSRNNIDNVPEFYDFAIRNHALPDYDFISCQGNASDGWEDLSLSARQKLQVLRQVNAKNREHGVEAQLPFCTGMCPLSDENAALSVLVKSDGSVQPCQMMYDSRYSLGNLFSDSAEQIAENFRSRVVSAVRAREETDFGCDRCAAKHTCKKGCPAHAISVGGDIFANDGDCEYRKLQLLGFVVMQGGSVRQ